MKNIKIISIGLFLLSFLILGFCLIQLKNQAEIRQKVVLAIDIRKVLGPLMLDLGRTRANIIQDVPADGEWRHLPDFLIKDRQIFELNGNNALFIADNIADLRVRREQNAPGILEVQVMAQKKAVLTMNLRLRIIQ